MRKASLSSCLTSSYTVQIRAQPSLLLPFLYQTRTLLLEPKTARPIHAVNNHNSHDRRRRAFSATSRGQAYAARKVQRSKADPIEFVDPHDEQIPDPLSHTEPQRQNQPSRPSTVTASEQAVFDRLINDFSTSKPDDQDILDQDELTGDYDPNSDLNSIFEAAIRELRSSEEEVAKGTARSRAFTARSIYTAAMQNERAIDTLGSDGQQALSGRSFKRPIKLPDGTLLWNDVETEEERLRLEVACDDHRTLVIGMLDSANSDAEIWQLLETEVFNLITQLDEHIRFVDRAHKERALDKAKVRKAKAEGKDVADVKLEKGDLTKKERKSIKLTHTKAIPINYLLSYLRSNYAEYCLHALRLFRKRYPASLYASNVLSAIKQRGPISYVLGVSTDLYNEVLFLKWTQYSDLHGMADTIQEMANQGIESNRATVALIEGIFNQRRMGQREFLGPVVKEWWAMRGTVEGLRRMMSLYGRNLYRKKLDGRILSEDSEREAMLVAEAEGAEGERESNKG